MPVRSLNRQRAEPYHGHRGYFRRWFPVERWKYRLTVVALVLSAGLVAAGYLLWARPAALYTHGPLARAHAPWADRCDACHAPYGAYDNPGSANPLDAQTRWRAFRCDTCHPGPPGDWRNYAPHYSPSDPGKGHLTADARSQDCTSCHRDHQGQDFPLARVTDAECVRCHQNLRGLYHGDPPPGLRVPSPTVTAFHTDHPAFHIPPRATGLKFNHALHLAPGLTERLAGAEPRNPNADFKLGQVDPAYRDRYTTYAKGPNEPLQLDCAACHQLDAGRGDTPPAPLAGLPAEALSPPRAAGAYYLPIVFDRHCQGCHSQTVSGLQSGHGVTTEPYTVPHRRQPAELDRLLRAEYTRQIAGQKNVFGKIPVPAPDRLDPPKRPPVAVPPTLATELDELMRLANGLLYDFTADRKEIDPKLPPSHLQGGHLCLKCHETPPGPGLPTIQPVRSPTVWLPHARFDHSAHRTVTCGHCHNTWQSSPVVRQSHPGWRPETVNLPQIEQCRTCHAPAAVVNGAPRGGVRHGCIDCHRYHGNSRPLHGPGSPLRDPAGGQLDADLFLRGGRPRGGRP